MRREGKRERERERGEREGKRERGEEKNKGKGGKENYSIVGEIGLRARLNWLGVGASGNLFELCESN